MLESGGVGERHDVYDGTMSKKNAHEEGVIACIIVFEPKRGWMVASCQRKRGGGNLKRKNKAATTMNTIMFAV